MQDGKENPISIAFGVEEDSGMRRGDMGDLTAFVAVADHLSFRAAASRLGVTPSALSHTMRQLESSVDRQQQQMRSDWPSHHDPLLNSSQHRMQ